MKLGIMAAAVAVIYAVPAFSQEVHTETFEGYCARDLSVFMDAMGGSADILFQDNSREYGLLLLKSPRGLTLFVVTPRGDSCLIWNAWTEEPAGIEG